MKNTTKTLAIAIIVLIATLNATAKERIGVFDSRAIAIWYFNSEEYRKEINGLHEGMKLAKEKNDTTVIKKLEERGQLIQKILHDKGFGRGSMAENLELFQDKIDTLAKAEKLSMIVSKWEVIYSSNNFETIDITEKLLKALGANEKLIKMYDEMKKQKPIKDAFFIED